MDQPRRDPHSPTENIFCLTLKGGGGGGREGQHACLIIVI